MKKEITALLLTAALMTSTLAACDQAQPNDEDIHTSVTINESNDPVAKEEVGEKTYYKIEKIELISLYFPRYFYEKLQIPSPNRPPTPPVTS